MNRPDPNSADQSANNDDDAVWLDLVARLEATQSSLVDDEAKDEGTGTVSSGAGRVFADFDPLGLQVPTDPVAGNAPAEKELDGRTPGPRDFEVDDDDGAFVPEDPPSLAGTEPLTMLAWLGAVGGPLALLFTAMFWRMAPLAAVMGIVAAFIASVVYLIMRLPGEKNEDDDGARI